MRPDEPSAGKIWIKAAGDPDQLPDQSGEHDRAVSGEVGRGISGRVGAGAESLCGVSRLTSGSFRGASRDEGLARVAASIAVASRGLDVVKGGLTILIENTAGAEYSLGGSFEQVADLLELLRDMVPIAACMDTCHVHVSGYDIVSPAGM